jgi:hypothetical protein
MQNLPKNEPATEAHCQLASRSAYVGFVKFVIRVADYARSQTAAVSEQERGDHIVLFLAISRVVIQNPKELGFARTLSNRAPIVFCLAPLRSTVSADRE